MQITTLPTVPHQIFQKHVEEMNYKQSKRGERNITENFNGGMAFSEASSTLAMVFTVVIIFIRHTFSLSFRLLEGKGESPFPSDSDYH